MGRHEMESTLLLYLKPSQSLPMMRQFTGGLRMLVRTFAFSLLAAASSCGIAHCEEMRWKNLIEASRPCDNASGNEIRETRHLAAPEGKAFEKDSVKVTAEAATRSFTDASGP